MAIPAPWNTPQTHASQARLRLLFGLPRNSGPDDPHKWHLLRIRPIFLLLRLRRAVETLPGRVTFSEDLVDVPLD